MHTCTQYYVRTLKNNVDSVCCCACFCSMAAIKPGDIVCDPMCGVGSICLEVRDVAKTSCW